MDGQIQALAAASVASVFDDDDLLREILLCLGFPTCLVRAALVSKRWLFHASAPSFLRRFRERHPPRLLGFCVIDLGCCQFVPLPQPPELAAPSRRISTSCDQVFARTSPEIKHCRNGHLIAKYSHDGTREALLVLLLTRQPVVVLPPTPPSPRDWDSRAQPRSTEMFLPEDGARDGITLVHRLKVGKKVYAEVCVLGSGGWGAPATAATEIELPDDTWPLYFEMLPPVHGKAFMVTTAGYALGLDLATATFFTLELPVGVWGNYMLSCAEDSGLYLVSQNGFQLSVWLHRMTGNSNGAGGWLLVDTFCVRETCQRLAGDSWVPHVNYLDVAAVGDNANFVFLDHPASGILFYVNLRSRVVEKVFERVAVLPIHISPVMMTWPPIFPPRNIGQDQEE